MGAQTFILSVPRETLLKVKRLAARRQMSVPALLTQTPERLARKEDAYAYSRLRHLRWLEQGAELGTYGQNLTERDELHE